MKLTTKSYLKPLIVLTFSALASCGPIYDTEYIYDPPENSSGRACIFQCENSKNQCEELDRYRKEECERHSEWQRERCEADIWRRKNREPKWHECGGETCSSNTERCETSYRSCYQSCGGKVRAETRCVMNCDQVPPGKR